MNVTVNGKREQSPVLVILGPGFKRADIALTERLVAALTGKHAYAFTDGTGTTTVGASNLDAAGPRNAADAANWEAAGRPADTQAGHPYPVAAPAWRQNPAADPALPARNAADFNRIPTRMTGYKPPPALARIHRAETGELCACAAGRAAHGEPFSALPGGAA